ncbi:MAG: acetate--CoA ligase family protein, partial [Halomonadaceae bacterium]
VYASIEKAVRVLAELGTRGEYMARGEQTAPAPAVASATGQALIQHARAQGRDLLEPEAKALLAEHGINVPRERMVRDASKLAEVAQAFAGTPVAMKVVSPDISHKSDAGGVVLGLEGEAALADAYAEIMRSAHAYNARARIEGVLVTPMAAKGVEVIVGLMRDPTFGPVLMFGLGGVLVEVLEDVAFRALPLSRQDAAGMLDQLKAGKVLDGVRGAAGVDKPAIIELLLGVSRLMEAYPVISELDLNPVIAYPDGYAVVDARIILERAE